MNIINFNEVLVWSSYCCSKQNESPFHTNGMKAESMTIILCKYVFHTLVFTVWTPAGVLVQSSSGNSCHATNLIYMV